MDRGDATDSIRRLESARRGAGDLSDRAAGRKDMQVRRYPDLDPGAGAVLSDSSKRHQSEVEYSAADDTHDPVTDQESAVLMLDMASIVGLMPNPKACSCPMKGLIESAQAALSSRLIVSTSAKGKVKKKELPLPNWLSAQILPP